MLNISSLLNLVKSFLSNMQSNVALDATMPAGPTIPSPTLTILKVERKDATQDGVFGHLQINGILVCETVENLGKEIPEGLYDAVIDLSPRLGYLCPHIRVPMRDQAAGGDAGIRIHKANEPCQLEGCIAPGSKRDGDAEDDSKDAFDKVMSMLPPPGIEFKVLVYAVH